jgi:hypothetical protein
MQPLMNTDEHGWTSRTDTLIVYLCSSVFIRGPELLLTVEVPAREAP